MMDVLVSEREEVLGGLLRVALPGHQHRDDVRRPEARHIAEDEDGDLDSEVDLAKVDGFADDDALRALLQQSLDRAQ